MAAPDLSGLIQVGYAVLRTVVTEKHKKILALLGDERGSTDSENAEWWQHVGFASRPSKVVKDKASAQVVVVRGGDRDTCIASQDLRGLDLYGTLEEGETCVYAAGPDGTGQARALFKGDGSIHLYTRKGNAAGGVGMTIQMDAQAGAIRLLNDKGYGIIIDENGISLTTGEAGLTMTGAGDVSLIAANKCQIDGAGICLGSIAQPVVNGALVGPTGLAGVSSTKVLISLA